MLSSYESIVALETLEKEIADLNNKLYNKRTEIRRLQKDCKHPIVIHYGDETLSKMYQQKYYLGNFYCPHCGQQNLRIERSPEGESFVLEASGFKNPKTPELNLKAVLEIYKRFTKALQEDPHEVCAVFGEAETLAERISHYTGIPYYRVKVNEW